MDENTLKNMSKGLSARVTAKVLDDNDPFLEASAWEEICKELEAGWMEVGPAKDNKAAWAMRFGLQQKEKTRVIDDFTNQCVGLSERLKIFGVDDIAALLAHGLDVHKDVGILNFFAKHLI